MSKGWITEGLRRRLPTEFEEAYGLMTRELLQETLATLRQDFIQGRWMHDLFKDGNLPHRSYEHNWGVPNA